MIAGETIQERLANRLTSDPDGRAIAYYRRGQAIEWITFGDLHDRAIASASVLASSGLRKGDTCVIVMPTGGGAVEGLLGTLLLGAIPLMVAPPTLLGADSDLPRILRHSIETTQARVVFAAAALRDSLRGLETDATVLFTDETESTKGTTVPIAGTIHPGEVGALQLTSGTTGLPRICAWSQAGILAAIDGMASAMELTPDDVCFNWTPLYHDMGLVNNLLTCLCLGIPLVLMSPHDFVKRPSDWLQGLHDTRATVTWSPNFGFALATGRTSPEAILGLDLSCVRGFWNAAERIHADTYAGFGRAFAHIGVLEESLKTNFGCAENIGGATFTGRGATYPIETIDRHLMWSQGVAITVDSEAAEAVEVVGCGVGHPLLEVIILDDEGRSLPDGRVGRVALDTPSRMIGYLGDEKATSEAFVGGLLLTGDLGYLRNGELFWVGRVRERITIRGKKFDPSDIEPALFRVDGLRKGCFAAFGAFDETEGTESLIVVSEVREASVDVEIVASTIRREVLAATGLGVAEVLLVPPGTLTKTSSGKRRHRHFRLLYESGALRELALGSARGG